MIRYSGREFSGLILKGIAGGALGYLLSGCGHETTKCNLMYTQAKSRLISPNDYLQEREKCLPEVVNAQKSGMLKRFLYNPPDKELEMLLRELFSNRVDEQKLQNSVQSSIESYKNTRRKGMKEVGAIIPGIIDVFGQRVPLYVAFTEDLFLSSTINNDEDVRSIVRHEMQHVKDWYTGITLGDVHISYNTISPGAFRIDFLEQLMELRGVYKELEDIFKERVETGRVSVSPQWFGSQTANYSTHWNFLEKYPATDLEKKTRELQFEQFKGIAPVARNDKISIRFNLFGKQDTAVLERTH